MKRNHSNRSVFPVLFLFASLILSMQAAKAGEDIKEKPAESVVSVWDVSKDGKTLSLAAFQQSAPMKCTVSAETRVEGVCIHCEIVFKCSVADIEKRCNVCPCGLTNAVCLTGKNSAEKTWTALFQNLPRGMRLRVEYVNPSRPQDGLKRLTVDRHGAVLPVTGLADVTSDQVQALGKSVGVSRTELNVAKTRLQLSLKDNWTAEKVSRMEKELAKLGAKLAPFPTETAELP